MRRNRKQVPPSLDALLLNAHGALDDIWHHPDLPIGELKAKIAHADMAVLDVFEALQRRDVSAN